MNLMRWIQERLGWAPPPRDSEQHHLWHRVEQIEQRASDLEQRVSDAEEQRVIRRLQGPIDLQRRRPQRGAGP